MTDNIELLKKSVEEIHGPDYFVNEKGDGRYDFHLYYDKVLITNSEGGSHLIEGLVIRFKVISNAVCSDLYAYRLKASKAEIQGNYIHSHASYHDGKLCLGYGPLRKIMAMLHRNEIDENNIEDFDYFLMNLAVYVRWESIEGGPHKRMSTIGTNGSPYRLMDSSNVLSHKYEIVRFTRDRPSSLLSSSNTKISLNTFFQNNHSIRMDEDFFEQTYDPTHFPKIYLYNGSDGKKYVHNSGSNGNGSINFYRDLARDNGVIFPIRFNERTFNGIEEIGSEEQLTFTPCRSPYLKEQILGQILERLFNKITII